MAGMRHDDGRVCLCDRPDGTCAGLAVQRLSRDRVRDGPTTQPTDLEQATSRLLDVLRPAA
jgi:hypothetical protein